MNALERLAHARGLEIEYYDALGRHRRASDESILAVLRALGEPLRTPDDAEAALARPDGERASVYVLWDGRGDFEVAHADGKLTVEGVSDLGERWSVRADVANGRAKIEGVPFGVHDALVSGAHAWILSAPTVSYGEPGRRWGLFAPLYALHDRTTPDAGDFGTLGRALDATRSRGGDCFATLPLLPVFAERNEPSPYAPVSRLFWNELYVDPRHAPELQSSDLARRLLESPPAQGDYLDWVALATHRFAILDALAVACGGERRAKLEAWTSARPHLQGYVDKRVARMADPARAAQTVRYAQWLADEQLAALGAKGGLYVDLPLGVHHDGYDAARFSDRFAQGISTGAPPDPLFEGGQSWGFPPLHPEKDRATGWSYLRQCLEHHMQNASVLRIDHAAWLHRLYWVPNGAPATDGVYVHHTNPDELHALLSLLSHRHRCRLVGEDLGTVPDAVRSSMARHREARTWVFYFFAHDWGWEPPPEGSVATLNTHDLPTFAGWWGAKDVDDWVDLGLYDEARAADAKLERSKLTSDLKRCLAMPEDASAREVHDRITLAVAEGPGDLLLLTLEDLFSEDRPQNVPGTFDEKPNWMRRAKEGLEALEKPENDALLADIRRRRPV
ncbi:MAG: 4-alpha-glucanotransferase [Myxococcota bacterium]|jgi:4-alpha-glucanotransferase|nr:4-alpha-glucanotransferase [Myxococcota bacterium]